MSSSSLHSLLIDDIEHYLAVLSKLYRNEGETKKLEIIVNAQVKTQGDWTYDGWNGGQYGHALYLALPEALYLTCVKSRSELQNSIRDDINQISDIQDEHIAEVFIELQRADDADWRQQSGLLRTTQRLVSAEAENRIWTKGYRVFLSHKTEVKKKTAGLKEALSAFGITAFVAHEDILPTQEWQNEIENALATMDAFVALLTEEFHESFWTDQEVGYAVARGVPIIAVRLGRDPYGFIGRFQGLSCDWEECPIEVSKLLIKHPQMLEAFLQSLKHCGSFGQGNLLSSLLPSIDHLSDDQVNSLLKNVNDNYELRNSFGFNGRNAYSYGGGLPLLIKRITGKELERGADNRLAFPSSKLGKSRVKSLIFKYVTPYIYHKVGYSTVTLFARFRG